METTCLGGEGDASYSSTCCQLQVDSSSLLFDLLSLGELSSLVQGHFAIAFFGAIAQAQEDCKDLS